MTCSGGSGGEVSSTTFRTFGAPPSGWAVRRMRKGCGARPALSFAFSCTAHAHAHSDDEVAVAF